MLNARWLLGLGLVASAALSACTTNTSLGQAGEDAAPDVQTTTGCKPASASVDLSCNDDSSSPIVAGTCQSDGTCVCSAGFELNPATLRCKLVAGADASSTRKVCTPGMDQTCNDLASMSALAGTCQADGTCVCRSGYALHLKTGLCGPGMALPDASPGDDASAGNDAGVGNDAGPDTADAPVGKDAGSDTADAPVGKDAGPDTAEAPRDAGPDREPACSYPVNETCNHNQAAMDSVRGICQPDGTCACLSGFVLVPSTGRCDLPALDAGLVTKPACTPGMDQTCNDRPEVSAVWGTCNANGTCSCDTGYVINASTGRCMSPLANSCSGAYDACGCGCCLGSHPQPVCYYPGAGDSLPTIIADDQEAKDNPACTAMGCSQGERYLCCTEADPEPAGSAQYNAAYTAGGFDRIGLTRVGADSYCVQLNLVQPGLSGTNPSKLRVTTPADWIVEGSISKSGCNVTTGSTAAIGAQGSVTFSPNGSSCAINAHMTLFFAASAEAPVTTMRIDADNVAIKGGPTGFCQ